MLGVFERLINKERNIRAPYMLHNIEPFSLKFWLCAKCLTMLPAIGLQAEEPPTDWIQHKVLAEDIIKNAKENGSYQEKLIYQDVFYLTCPKCKEDE